ncbi:hypothetical protein ACJOMK_06575, partial [Mycoplasmopsis synoviae]
VLELKKKFKNLEVHLISGLSEKLKSEVLELAKEFNVIVSKVCIASSVTVAHTGPNAVAIAFMPSVEEFKKYLYILKFLCYNSNWGELLPHIRFT